MRDRVKRRGKGKKCVLKTWKRREFGRVEVVGEKGEEAGSVEDGRTDR